MLKKMMTVLFICFLLALGTLVCQGLIRWYNTPGTIWGPEIIETVTLTITEVQSGSTFKATDLKTGEEFRFSLGKTSVARKLRVNEDQITLVRIRKFAENTNSYQERFQDVRKNVDEIVKGR